MDPFFLSFFLSSLDPFYYCLQEQGAATTVYVATSLALDKVGGLYFNNCCRCSPSKSAQDSKLALALWNLTDTIIQESEEKDSPQEESRS